MSKESPELPDSVEKKITFDRETICALGRAFKKNPEVAKELEELVGKEKMKTFTDILENTNEMEIKFDPPEELKTAYSQIAKRELERIDAEGEGDEDLVCGHSIDEHWQALALVVEKMEPTVN